MKAVQMDHYNKQRCIVLRDVPIPTPTGTQVLIWVKAAAVNPLDLLTLSGEVRLLQPASLPVTLGNECAGVIVQTGPAGVKFSARRPGVHTPARGARRRLCRLCDSGSKRRCQHARRV